MGAGVPAFPSGPDRPAAPSNPVRPPRLIPKRCAQLAGHLVVEVVQSLGDQDETGSVGLVSQTLLWRPATDRTGAQDRGVLRTSAPR